ncbi:MAG: YceI family protein [Betaproteobacteria bacterium]|nr:YceI family protein [Betaproteobacteria bacterium]
MLRVTLGALALALPLAASAAPENYTLDPYHTYAHFAVDHLGVSLMWGRFDKSSGKFMLDRAAKKGALEINIETASLTTGDIDKGSRPRSRDEHLKGADFFNVAEFPRMSFKASDVRFDGEKPIEVAGELTLLGATKPLALKIERWVCKDHPFSKKPMCGGNASGAIKRSEFGMKYGLPAVGDDIRLYVEFEGYKE